MVVLGIGGSYMGARALDRGLLPSVLQRAVARRSGAAGRGSTSRATTSITTPRKACCICWATAVRPNARKTAGPSWSSARAAARWRRPSPSACSWPPCAARSAATPKSLAELVVPVTGDSGKLCESGRRPWAASEIFRVPDGVGGRFSVLSAVGLLPAAMMGLDVMHAAEGRRGHERALPHRPGRARTPCCDYVGVCHLMEDHRGATIRVLSPVGKALEAVGLWYDQLLAESLGKDGQGATPLTVVNTRDLHSRGQQHQEGRRTS